MVSTNFAIEYTGELFYALDQVAGNQPFTRSKTIGAESKKRKQHRPPTPPPKKKNPKKPPNNSTLLKNGLH